ncbi:MAG: hypothetical protein HZB99_02050 [Candidatus Harrisonbacteria bacterium]|nr:hypothetical protein [Candidatus Harrisonbacteria bacterium]
MDIFSHALWSGGIYKAISLPPRKKLKILWAVFFGVAPDLFSFGILFIENLFFRGLFRPEFASGEHGLNGAFVPHYVFTLYNYTHSLIVFLAVFLLIWLIRRKPFWEMGTWGLHILSDIPTHTSRFFPTPFLWPFSPYKASVISWARLEFLIPNYSLLIIFYGIIYWLNKRPNKKTPQI